MLRSAKSLKGYRLGAIDDELGRIKDFYFDDQTWRIRYIVADTGHWLAHRKVLLSPHALGPIDDEHHVLNVQLTREQIEKSPPIESHRPVSRQFEEDYFRYFGWPFYWAEPVMWIPPVFPTPPIDHDKQDDPHLRSMSEVLGYQIQARDGEIGHVDDLLLADKDWVIRDLIVDTRHWLKGRRVLIAPQWIETVSWVDSKVVVNLDQNAIRQFPAFDSEHPESAEVSYTSEEIRPQS